MQNLLRDLKISLRGLLRRPGFLAVAILTLALGIGVNSAIFSVVNAVLLEPFPYAEPERLVVVWETQHEQGLPLMYAAPPNFTDWQEQSASFSAMGLFDDRGFFFAENPDAEPQRLWGARVSTGLFDMLGVAPVQGRGFVAADAAGDSAAAVIVSQRLWQTRFGGDPALLGRTVLVDELPHEVVGVMPDGFDFPPPISLEANLPPAQVDLWVPISDEIMGYSRSAHFLTALGRLAPGVSEAEAEAEMTTIARRLEAEYPDSNRGWGVTLVPMTEQVLGGVSGSLWLLVAAAGLVLLIACVNVANLLLARGTDRRRELAVRAALGAGRRRLAAQLLSESLLLALLGGVVGLLLARWSMEVMVRLAPSSVPRLEQVGLDPSILLFTAGVTLVTGLLCGLAPAVRLPATGLSSPLSDGGRGRTAAGSGLRSLLVAAEVALSVLLLLGALLLGKSFLSLTGIDPGFSADDVLTARVTLPRAVYNGEGERTGAEAFREIEERVRALPGVEAAGFIYDLPLAADRQGTNFFYQDEAEAPAGEQRQTNFSFVTPGYYQAAGVPLIAGRLIESGDGPQGEPVILINDAFRRYYFADRGDPVGQRLYVGFSSDTPRRIVGVVGDVRHNTLDAEPTPTVYAPYAQVPWGRSLSLAVRASVPAESLAGAVRGVIRQVEPQAPFYEVRPLTEVLSDSVAQPRFATLLFAAFGLLALVLAAVGIYGVIAYNVGQRTREIGLRLALGAQRGRILREVVGQGMVPAAIGLAAGLLIAFAGSRVLAGMLYGISPTDPATYLASAAFLAIIAAAACFLPARRATRVDPAVALRDE